MITKAMKKIDCDKSEEFFFTMKVYRRKISGSVKSKKNKYCRVSEKERILSPEQLENPGKLRIKLHMAATHLSYEEDFVEDSIGIVDV